MQKNKLRAVEITALAVAELVTLAIMLRATGGNVDSGTLLFIGWAVSPYVCFLVAGLLVERFTSIPHTSLILCVVALLMLGFTLLTYVGTLNDTSSTGVLIFLFVPLYLYIGSFILLIIGLVIAWLSGRRGDKDDGQII